MQPFPFEKSDIILYEDDPFAEYLRNTSQRLDNVRFEKYEHALNKLSTQNTSPKAQTCEYENEKQITKEINRIQKQLQDDEYQKCLLILYIICPCLIQPITKHQQIINNIISDFSYNVESHVMDQIYAGLYSYFHDNSSNNTSPEPTQSLFTSTLIISNRFLLFFLFILHSLILLYPPINYKIIQIVEIFNIIFLIIDIYEYYEWISFFNTIYALIHHLSSFELLIDKSFKILNNTTAIINGYSLHNQYISSYKIEEKNASHMHLHNLRLELYQNLTDINAFLYKMTSLIADNNNNNIRQKKDELMLSDLLLLYKYFRINKKILFVQLYRISNPLIYSNKLYKNIRALWFKGIIFNKTQINYIQSPFSPYQLHVNLLNLFKNKFYSINCLLITLSEKVRNANIAFFKQLKLSKNVKQFNTFSSKKMTKNKNKNLAKIEHKLVDNNNNNNVKERLDEIYNHLYRLQNRIDTMSSHIYLMHEECVNNPTNIIVENESKYDINDDICDEIEENKSLDIMRDLLYSINRSFNEWKFIVSKINPRSQLLEKYKNIGFNSYKTHSYSMKNEKYEQELENIIETDNNVQTNGFEEEKKNIMNGLFAKISKQRAKMSITEDGEELYEATQEIKMDNNNNANNDISDLLDASLVNPGCDIGAMDRYNMVDELKNVLKNRKKAKIKELKNNDNNEEKKEEKMDAIEVINNMHGREEVIENYYSDSGEDNGFNIEDTVSVEQEKRFLQELNRLGLNHGAMLTSRNTQIQSFGYDQNEDKNTMTLFAMLQNQNRKEINSVLNGDANDVNVEFKINDNKNEIIEQEADIQEEEEEDVMNDDWHRNESELQKSLQEQRSDDEGTTLADELGGLM